MYCPISINLKIQGEFPPFTVLKCVELSILLYFHSNMTFKTLKEYFALIVS